MRDNIKIIAGHHRCTSLPKRQERIKCTWCLKSMIGNSFANHKCIQPRPKYMSYEVLGVRSVASFFTQPSQPSNATDSQSVAIAEEGTSSISKNFVRK